MTKDRPSYNLFKIRCILDVYASKHIDAYTAIRLITVEAFDTALIESLVKSQPTDDQPRSAAELGLGPV